MAKRKRRRKVTVEVMWMADGTIQIDDVFTADKATDQRKGSRGVVIRFVNGRDANGVPVLRASYRRVERIMVRPGGE